MSEIYEPAEDSYLLSKVLKKEIKNKNIKVLEVGSGGGIQLKALRSIGISNENIFGVDINLEAVNRCRELEFNCAESNLFEAFKMNVKQRKPWFSRRYNLIIFNPPYLPIDKSEPKESQLATTGGKKGSEIINEFLKQAKNYLKKNGRIFLLTSSLTKEINWLDYKKKIVGKKKIFFEELFVWELKV